MVTARHQIVRPSKKLCLLAFLAGIHPKKLLLISD